MDHPELNWSPPPIPISIDLQDAHVWRIPLVIPANRLAFFKTMLSPEERERAAVFYFEKDRYSFISAHGSLRLILSGYLGADPASLTFAVQDSGKPVLLQTQGETPLEFNLSHSGEWALLAVTLGRVVGVDIELIRPDFDIHQLARQSFSQREVSDLSALPVEQQRQAFFACWTRKEAYIKATGAGLSTPLDQFDVSCTPDQPAALLATRPDANEAVRWSMASLPSTPGYASALVVAGPLGRLSCFDFSTCR